MTGGNIKREAKLRRKEQKKILQRVNNLEKYKLLNRSRCDLLRISVWSRNNSLVTNDRSLCLNLQSSVADEAEHNSLHRSSARDDKLSLSWKSRGMKHTRTWAISPSLRLLYAVSDTHRPQAAIPRLVNRPQRCVSFEWRVGRQTRYECTSSLWYYTENFEKTLKLERRVNH